MGASLYKLLVNMTTALYQKVGLSLGSILVCLLAVELILRWTHWLPEMPGDALAQEADWYQREVRLNSSGFRDGEWGVKDKLRLMLVSDSVGFGWGIKQEEMLASLLEQDLGIEVVNLSKFGINLKDELELYENYKDSLEPDVVVFLLNPNDIEMAPLPNRGINIRIPIDRIDHKLNSWSYSYAWFKNRFNLVAEKLGLRVPYEVWNLNLYETRPREFKRLLARLPKQTIVVLVPAMTNLKNYRWQRAHQLIKPTIDMLPIFGKFRIEELWVSRSDTHPNALANKIMADVIKEFLGKQKIGDYDK